MNDAIILQQIYRNSAYSEIMAMVFPRHLEYAKAHNFDYEFYYGDIVSEWEYGKGGWAKLALIQASLNRNYKYVVWVDADSLIADMNADLRDGCPADGIGFALHRNPIHYNVGNIYATNCEPVRAFVSEWISWYPGPQSWHEQAVLNLLARTSDVVKQIDDRYNSCRAAGNRVDHPIVEGFHGEGAPENRIKLMKAYLKTLK